MIVHMKQYPISKYTMTTEDVAKVLGLCTQWVRIKARTGRLPALKVGREWKFCEEEIGDVLRNMTVKVIEENNKTTNKKEDDGETSQGTEDTSDIFC